MKKTGRNPYGRPVEIAAVTPGPAPVAPTEQQQFAQNVKDVYFEYDRADLLPQDQATLQQDADWLKSHPNVLFTIAGEADPRGDIVYNVYLSDQRALATRDALIKLGVPEQQILFAEGWGKLYPVCEQDDESCWTQDRRAHLSPWSPDAGPTLESSTASGLQ
jgi:outer membrane protein OmpA-like peptidoglycan-associated protein